MRAVVTLISTILLAACDSPIVPPTGELPRYGYIANGGPLVVLLAWDIEGTFDSIVDDKLVSTLDKAGYSLLTLDLPCHEPGSGSNHLQCWRERIDNGDATIFSAFCDDLSAVLDRLGIDEAVALGQSRGGYVAVTCAAREPRISQLILLKPVTDLQKLREFAGHAVDQSAFGLAQYADMIRSRRVSIIIGSNDTRVDTSSAVAFGVLVGAAIETTSTPEHSLPTGGRTAARVLQ